MTSIRKLAVEVTLKTMLIETIRNGIRYAQLKSLAKKIDEENLARQNYRINHEGMAVAADILASILPGVCPAQVQSAFENITEDVIFTYDGIDESQIEMIVQLIYKS